MKSRMTLEQLSPIENGFYSEQTFYRKYDEIQNNLLWKIDSDSE